LHGQDRDIFSVDFNANGFTMIEQDASDISGNTDLRMWKRKNFSKILSRRGRSHPEGACP